MPGALLVDSIFPYLNFVACGAHDLAMRQLTASKSREVQLCNHNVLDVSSTLGKDCRESW